MASSPQHEPTMEEILASIRKIISEDAPEGSTPAAPPSAGAEAPDTEVLELTQEMPEEPVTPPARTSAPLGGTRTESDVSFQPREEPPVAAAAPSADDDIFSDKTRKALDDTFSHISDKIPEVPAEPRPTTSRPAAVGGNSVEAVFERAVSNAVDPLLHDWMDKNKSDLLTAVKPLIREWMDEHFPALLEGAVRNEVERVVKARGNKR
jgi:cell pole-organizing protein PopZ